MNELNLESTSGTLYMGSETLESVEHTDDGKIVTVHRIINSISCWPNNGNTYTYNDQAIKRIYKAENGKIVLDETIFGEYIPPEPTKETIKWNE